MSADVASWSSSGRYWRRISSSWRTTSSYSRTCWACPNRGLAAFNSGALWRVLALGLDRQQGFLIQMPTALLGVVGLWFAVATDGHQRADGDRGCRLRSGDQRDATASVPFGGASFAGRFQWTVLPMLLAWSAMFFARLQDFPRWLTAVGVTIVVLWVVQGVPMLMGDHVYLNRADPSSLPWDPALYPGWWPFFDRFLPALAIPFTHTHLAGTLGHLPAHRRAGAALGGPAADADLPTGTGAAVEGMGSGRPRGLGRRRPGARRPRQPSADDTTDLDRCRSLESVDGGGQRGQRRPGAAPGAGGRYLRGPLHLHALVGFATTTDAGPGDHAGTPSDRSTGSRGGIPPTPTRSPSWPLRSTRPTGPPTRCPSTEVRTRQHSRSSGSP